MLESVLLVCLLLWMSPADGFRILRTYRNIPRLGQLRPGTEEKIEALKEEYQRLQLESQTPMLDSEIRSELDTQLRFCETVFNCVSALQSIDADLELFQEHLQGDNDKLKDTAEVFTGEFLQCKTQIESQLNKILWESDSQ